MHADLSGFAIDVPYLVIVRDNSTFRALGRAVPRCCETTSATAMQSVRRHVAAVVHRNSVLGVNSLVCKVSSSGLLVRIALTCINAGKPFNEAPLNLHCRRILRFLAGPAAAPKFASPQLIHLIRSIDTELLPYRAACAHPRACPDSRRPSCRLFPTVRLPTSL